MRQTTDNYARTVYEENYVEYYNLSTAKYWLTYFVDIGAASNESESYEGDAVVLAVVVGVVVVSAVEGDKAIALFNLTGQDQAH